MAGKTRPINYILNTIKKDYIKQPRDQKYSWLQLQIQVKYKKAGGLGDFFFFFLQNFSEITGAYF